MSSDADVVQDDSKKSVKSSKRTKKPSQVALAAAAEKAAVKAARSSRRSAKHPRPKPQRRNKRNKTTGADDSVSDAAASASQIHDNNSTTTRGSAANTTADDNNKNKRRKSSVSLARLTAPTKRRDERFYRNLSQFLTYDWSPLQLGSLRGSPALNRHWRNHLRQHPHVQRVPQFSATDLLTHVHGLTQQLPTVLPPPDSKLQDQAYLDSLPNEWERADDDNEGDEKTKQNTFQTDEEHLLATYGRVYKHMMTQDMSDGVLDRLRYQYMPYDNLKQHLQNIKHEVVNLRQHEQRVMRTSRQLGLYHAGTHVQIAQLRGLAVAAAKHDDTNPEGGARNVVDNNGSDGHAGPGVAAATATDLASGSVMSAAVGLFPDADGIADQPDSASKIPPGTYWAEDFGRVLQAAAESAAVTGRRGYLVWHDKY